MTIEEPKSIAEARQTTLRAFMASWRAEYARDPQNTAEPGKCRHCGAFLGSTNEELTIDLHSFGFLPNVCCLTCSDAGKVKLAGEQRLGAERRLAGTIPAEFARWDPAKGNADGLTRALAKFNISGRRGMVLHGPTGSCKTRIAWELIKKVAEQPENFTWHWLDAFDAANTKFPNEARTADYLVVDDLGNEPKKGWETKWETELLYILRKRCDNHKPVIVTTQLTPQAFKERFFNNPAAEAIMRRFRERTDSLAT